MFKVDFVPWRQNQSLFLTFLPFWYLNHGKPWLTIIKKNSDFDSEMKILEKISTTKVWIVDVSLNLKFYGWSILKVCSGVILKVEHAKITTEWQRIMNGHKNARMRLKNFIFWGILWKNRSIDSNCKCVFCQLKNCSKSNYVKAQESVLSNCMTRICHFVILMHWY